MSSSPAWCSSSPASVGAGGGKNDRPKLKALLAEPQSCVLVTVKLDRLPDR